jgi:hypothetical protein
MNGRIVGIPSDLHRETIVLEFISRPNDFIAQKASLAEAMREAPYWDPVFVQNAEAERSDDTVLEARAQLWDIDRLTLELTATDIIAGEEDLIEVGEGDATYADTTVTISSPPLTTVQITATVAWKQAGSGVIDITNTITSAARNPGMGYQTIGPTMDGPSLFQNWPKPGASIGPGYTWDAGCFILDGSTMLGPTGQSPPQPDVPFEGGGGFLGSFVIGVPSVDSRKWIVHYNKQATPGPYGLAPERAEFTAGTYHFRSLIDWEANRKRTEMVVATVTADVQPVLTDPAGAEVLKLDITAAAEIDQPIDPDGGMPIGNPLRNSYFKTSRGQTSFEYVLCLARAKLLDRARCVVISFKTTWAIAAGITCRHSVRLIDRRLPGGLAIGKVTAYTLRAGGNEISATVTIACTVGYGNGVSAVDGENVYIDDYIDDYYAEENSMTALDTGDITYQSFDDFEVVDDGLNLLNFGPDQAVKDIIWSGGPPENLNDNWSGFVPSDSLGLFGLFSDSTQARDPVAEANAVPTTLTIRFRPVQGSEFSTVFTPEVSPLMVPQTINLEAPSDA